MFSASSIYRTAVPASAGGRLPDLRVPVGEAGGGSGKAFLQVLQGRGPAPVPAIDGSGAKDLRGIAEWALDADKRVDALMAAVGRGKTFSAAELIALQATVFRYSQTIEVVSRAVDRLVGAVRQTLGTQI